MHEYEDSAFVVCVSLLSLLILSQKKLLKWLAMSKDFVMNKPSASMKDGAELDFFG
jgi:hypothetical protein